MNNINKTARKIKRQLKNLGVREISDLLNTYGYSVSFMGTDDGNEELVRYELEDYARGKKSFIYNHTAKLVFIRFDLHTQEQVYLLLHELSHIVLGHIGDGYSEAVDKTFAEIEADALTWLIIANEKYFKFLKRAIAIAIISAVLFLTATGTIIVKSAISKTTYAPQSTPTQEIIQESTSEETVFITPSGECFHRSSCRYAKISDATEIKRSDATKSYRPCKLCNP